MQCVGGRSLLAIACFAASFVWCVGYAAAQSATWNGTADTNWLNPANWTPATVPGEIATFDGSGQTTITLDDAEANIETLSFQAGAPAYTFNFSAVTAQRAFDFFGGGIQNASGSAPIFNVSGASNVNNFYLGFFGAATAANAVINGNSDTVVTFFDDSTAGESVITAGVVSFDDESTAGNATIDAIQVYYSGTASAGNATFTIRQFAWFAGNATGGSARFILNNGEFDIAPLASGGMTVGSLEGTGVVILGSKNLEVGGNNLSTTLAAVIQDKGINDLNAAGGSITKVGTGTLTLTGDNTYTGGTTISEGTLQLGNGGATGSIIGPVVNNATLAFNRSDVYQFDGTITGSGKIVQDGSGIVVLTAQNGYAGGTFLNDGALSVSSEGNLGALAGALSFDGGTLQVTGGSFNSTGRTINWGPSGGGFDIADEGNAFTVSQQLTGSGGLWVGNLGGPGTLVLTASNTYSGPTDIYAGTLLVNGSIASPTTVHAAGTLGGVGIVNDDVTNFGTASPGTGGLNEALTINGNYVSQGGTLAIRTALEGDSSPTTQLIIAGAGHSATGSTGIVVTNVGGKGAETSGIGIPIVLPQGGATIAGGSFHLARPVAAGPFEYLLFQGTIDRKGTAAQEQTFYLRNVVEAVGPDGQPILEPDGEPELIPIYRPDVSIHSVFGAMARQQGLTTLGTFHDRAGDQRLAASSGPRTAAWGRLFGEHMEQGHSGHVNAHFEGNTGGIQAGIDALQWTSASGHQDRLGLIAAYARTSGNVRGFALGETNRMAGRAAIDGTSFGGYWTHLAPSGWYTDTVVVGTRFDADGDTVVGNDLESKGYGVTASIEGGYPIPLVGSLRLEPQAQLVYTHINIDDVNDPYSYVAYETPDALSGRLGVRISADLLPLPLVLRPYLKANIWQDFTGIDSIYFEGVHEIESRHRATKLELGGGLVAQLSSSVGVWLTADYTTDIGGSDEEIETVRGTAGLRVIW